MDRFRNADLLVAWRRDACVLRGRIRAMLGQVDTELEGNAGFVNVHVNQSFLTGGGGVRRGGGHEAMEARERWILKGRIC